MNFIEVKNFIINSKHQAGLYAIRFKDTTGAVGRFDLKEVTDSSTGICKFYLNDDWENSRYKTKVIEINFEDILTMDAF